MNLYLCPVQPIRPRWCSLLPHDDDEAFSRNTWLCLTKLKNNTNLKPILLFDAEAVCLFCDVSYSPVNIEYQNVQLLPSISHKNIMIYRHQKSTSD